MLSTALKDISSTGEIEFHIEDDDEVDEETCEEDEDEEVRDVVADEEVDGGDHAGEEGDKESDAEEVREVTVGNEDDKSIRQGLFAPLPQFRETKSLVQMQYCNNYSSSRLLNII